MLTSTLFRRALVALVLAVPLVATGGTAQAAACSGSSGVTVIVQFPDHTVSGCALGDPSSGTAALTSAGFSYTYADGQAFVCSINTVPKAPCGRTPPANAYWAYFHAKRGGGWSYSSQGAASSNPAPGSVEGWRFGNGAKPGTPPPAAAQAPKPNPKPAPKPAPKPRPSTGPAPSGGTSSAGNPGGAAPSRSGTPKKSAATKPAGVGSTKAAKPATSAAPVKKNTKDKKAKGAAGQGTKHKEGAASLSATPSGEPSEAVVSAPAQTSTQPTGDSSRSWLWGVAALVVLGGAAGAVTVVRRR